MAVSHRVRQIEREIDTAIRELPIWQGSRAEVLGNLVRTYRDAIELSFGMALHAETFDSPDDFGAALIQENRFRAGSLWLLKWALEYCPEVGVPTSQAPEELVDLLTLGETYETFVDALKYAQHDLMTVAVDEPSRTIVFYEGGSATAFDSSIIHHQQITSPMIPHVSLTEDSDRLTSRWTAGDYRRVAKSLADRAAQEENTIFVDPGLLEQIGKNELSIAQPAVVWLDRPAIVPDCYVFDDLTLPTADDKMKWRLVALLDTPIVPVSDKFCALSSDLKTIARIDDYMLRLAARVDPDEYSAAATLREDRMISICRNAFEQCVPRWSVTARVLYKNPSQEADVLTSRGANTVVLQLKSTLRPETPWEVYKRNEGLIDGIYHTKGLVDRGVAKQGFVVTDGYRGDYTCWAKAIAYGIPIATLYDLEVIGSDPIAAFAEVKNRVGIQTLRVDPLRELRIGRQNLWAGHYAFVTETCQRKVGHDLCLLPSFIANDWYQRIHKCSKTIESEITAFLAIL